MLLASIDPAVNALKALTVLGVAPRAARRHSIVYVERADGDGEQVAIFGGDCRPRAIAYALHCSSEWHEDVLLVEDNDVGAWPEILEDFQLHASLRRIGLQSVTRWSVLRICGTARWNRLE